jgi:dihydrofolate reductase
MGVLTWLNGPIVRRGYKTTLILHIPNDDSGFKEIRFGHSKRILDTFPAGVIQLGRKSYKSVGDERWKWDNET